MIPPNTASPPSTPSPGYREIDPPTPVALVNAKPKCKYKQQTNCMCEFLGLVLGRCGNFALVFHQIMSFSFLSTYQ